MLTLWTHTSGSESRSSESTPVVTRARADTRRETAGFCCIDLLIEIEALRDKRRANYIPTHYAYAFHVVLSCFSLSFVCCLRSLVACGPRTLLFRISALAQSFCADWREQPAGARCRSPGSTVVRVLARLVATPTRLCTRPPLLPAHCSSARPPLPPVPAR